MYACSNCGQTSNWKIEICPACGEVDTYILQEKASSKKSKAKKAAPNVTTDSKVELFSDIKYVPGTKMHTGYTEFDRALGGGGFEHGSLVLMGGPPGIGKTTVLLGVASHVSQEMPVLYVSAEENAAQIKMRASKMDLEPEHLYMVYETNVDAIIDLHVREVKPQLLIIDSLTRVMSDEVAGRAGAPAQMSYALESLKRLAKKENVVVVMPAHVTKEGTIQGRQEIIHDADVTLMLDGDPYQPHRFLRADKNRFGSSFDVGVLEMTDTGIKDVPNPSAAMLSNRAADKSGSAIMVVMEGARPILAEVQALVNSTSGGYGARHIAGLPKSRLHMIVAVLSKYLDDLTQNLPEYDIFANIAGGLRVAENSGDLALALAIVSSYIDKPLPEDMIAIGEVGLTGVVTPVPGITRRIKESVAMGYKRIICPKIRNTTLDLPDDVEVTQCRTIDGAVRAAYMGLLDLDELAENVKAMQRARRRDESQRRRSARNG